MQERKFYASILWTVMNLILSFAYVDLSIASRAGYECTFQFSPSVQTYFHPSECPVVLGNACLIPNMTSHLPCNNTIRYCGVQGCMEHDENIELADMYSTRALFCMICAMLGAFYAWIKKDK